MKKLFLFLSAGFFAFNLVAQDAEGCADHPFFTRMPGFSIESCQTNFNMVDFQTGAGEMKETQEGNVTTVNYVLNTENGQKPPSPLQIIKNYENAILSKGGKKIYSGEDVVDGGVMGATFTLSANGKNYWVAVRRMYMPQVNTEVGAYLLIVLEKEAMKQEIAASELFSEISKNGHVALYINFETGKSGILPESEKIVGEIVNMLNTNPELKINIEGHTDNTGTATSNKILSEKRAQAVMNALIGKGINKDRLTAKGWGQEKPVSGNDSEEGKAKNRRVEIVKV